MELIVNTLSEISQTHKANATCSSLWKSKKLVLCKSGMKSQSLEAKKQGGGEWKELR